MVGFSPRGSSLSIYSGMYSDEAAPYLKALGKHKISKACLYINKLADVDMAALEKLLKAGLASIKKSAKDKGWPTAAS
jgi:flagellar motor switch protein FliG